MQDGALGGAPGLLCWILMVLRQIDAGSDTFFLASEERAVWVPRLPITFRDPSDFRRREFIATSSEHGRHGVRRSSFAYVSVGLRDNGDIPEGSDVPDRAHARFLRSQLHRSNPTRTLGGGTAYKRTPIIQRIGYPVKINA